MMNMGQSIWNETAFSHSGAVCAKMEWIKTGYEFKARCSCSWSSCMYKQFYSQGTAAGWCLQGMPSSFLLFSAPGVEIFPPSRLPVPAPKLLHPSSDLLISPKWQKTLQSFDFFSFFFPPWVRFLQHSWVTLQVGRRRKEHWGRRRTFPAPCWRAAAFAHRLLYGHVDNLEQDGFIPSEFNAKVNY